MEAPSGTMLSEEEAHLYDRQIRLWGIDAQKKYLMNHLLSLKLTESKSKDERI
jgi:molybdopterin/thiamine biosynthesis adenylyltransferase